MASTRLTRTASGGSNQIYTASCWVKRTKLGTTTSMLTTGNGGADSNARMLIFDATDKIEIAYYNAGFTYQVTTNRLFRDTSAWYHLVVAVDTTQVTASDRIKIYVNGVQETSFATSSYPSLNATFNYNSSAQYIGDLRGSGIYGEFLLSHFNYIDGLAYDADTFGETDATTGIWKPKTAPSVTYGTNGFFLKGENSGALGTDSSGEGNDFTVNGTPTQTVDTPANVFATGNPLISNLGTWSNGNNTIVGSSSTDVRPQMWSTLGATTGKYYCECKYTDKSGATSGVADYTAMSSIVRSGTYNGAVSGSSSYQPDGSVYNNGGGTTPYGSALSNNDILSMALDLDNNKLYYGVNGVWQNSGDPTSGATGTGAVSLTNTNDDYWFFSHGDGSSGSSATAQVNYGNGFFGTTAVASATTDESGLGIFEYDVPTGYYALCTKNINEQEYS